MTTATQCYVVEYARPKHTMSLPLRMLYRHPGGRTAVYDDLDTARTVARGLNEGRVIAVDEAGYITEGSHDARANTEAE